MTRPEDTDKYARDVDDPVLVEINRKLDSTVTTHDDVGTARPWFADPDEDKHGAR